MVLFALYSYNILKDSVGQNRCIMEAYTSYSLYLFGSVGYEKIDIININVNEC